VRTAIASALLVAAAAIAAPAAALTPGAPKPNVLVLMTDDQTVESMRVMPNVRTLLGEEGATFLRSFASYPLCCPSRATYLTGQYAHNHGVFANRPPAGGFERLDHANTLAVWLQGAGYHTVHLGKYLNGYGRRSATEVPPGWSEWYGSVDPSTYQFYGYTLNENGRLVGYGSDPASYQTDVYAGKAVEIVRRLAPADPPFFLSVAFLAPHSGGPRTPDDPRGVPTPEPAPRHRDAFANEPLPPSAAFNEADVSDKPRTVRRRRPFTAQQIAAITENYRQRLESLLAVDEAVAAIVAALEQSGELDETLIVFTSDNGFFHGEHRIPFGKVLPYEPSARVPLVLRGPGVPRGVQVGNLVANVDVAPTIVDAADALQRRRMDGRSLFPLLEDPGLEWGRDILIEAQGYDAIRTRRYTYVFRPGTGEAELYDLERDPEQLRNVAGEARYRGVRDDLSVRLRELESCSWRSCRTRPRLTLELRYAAGRGRCARGPLRATVRGSDLDEVVFADFSVAGRRIGRDGRFPFTKVVSRRSLSRSKRRTVRALAVLEDGRAVTIDRQVRRC
jgi:N-acetylglucosamine-6-sulfatase